jgi:hypothetical protein
MNPTLQDTLNTLAQKLGTTAERVFPMLVAQERLSAWVWIAVGIALTSLCGVAFRRCYKLTQEDDDFGPILFLIPFIGVIFSLFIWCNIPEAIYPEASAIRSILNSSK